MSESNSELVNVYFLKDISEDRLNYLAVGRALYDYKPGTILRIAYYDSECEEVQFDTTVISHMSTWRDGEEYAMLEKIAEVLLGQPKMYRVKARQVYIDD